MWTHWSGVFSVTSSGTCSLAASSARSPKVADLPLAWVIRPRRTVISAAGRFQRAAAARTSMARAVAPALRYCSKELGIAVEPPVPWMPKKRFL